LYLKYISLALPFRIPRSCAIEIAGRRWIYSDRGGR
jgi:hypothetical protein